jgi:hypothetical protein
MKKIVRNLITVAAILPGTSPETWKLDPNPGSSSDIVNIILGNATQLAFTLAGGVAVLMLIYGGFTYITAYGNEARATTAKNTIIWSIVGLVVVILAKVIYAEVIGLVS